MNKLYHQTMTALAESLQCTLIASDLDFERGVLPQTVEEDEILAYALANRFSRIPLFSGEESERLITYVALVDLEGERLVERRPITVEDVISGSTPIDKAIQLLTRRPFYFVLDPHCIRKILTVSDLNRLPVRTYLHTLLDHLEGLLAEWIEQAFLENSWKTSLSGKRQESIQGLHEQKRREDFDTRLIDCTTLSDKATIIGKSDRLQGELSQPTRSAFKKRLKPIKRLRNRLAHGMPPLDKEADTLRDHLRPGGLLTKRADLEWLNQVVLTLLAWIEALSGTNEEQADHGA